MEKASAKPFEDRLRALKAEEQQLKQILTAIRKEINKFQVRINVKFLCMWVCFVWMGAAHGIAP